MGMMRFMDRSDIKMVQILKSEVLGTPLLQITTKDGSTHGFYMNEYDVTQFVHAISDAYNQRLFHLWLLDLRLYDTLRNLEHEVK